MLMAAYWPREWFLPYIVVQPRYTWFITPFDSLKVDIPEPKAKALLWAIAGMLLMLLATSVFICWQLCNRTNRKLKQHVQ